MARTIRNASLESRAARARLKAQGKPYYCALEEGLHLGYRKPKGSRRSPAGAGKWVVRHYNGAQAYSVETIAAADDFSDPDGVAILSYSQAQAAARERMVRRAHTAAGITGPLTVRAAVESYIEFLKSKRRSARDAQYKAETFIYPALGHREVESLTTDDISRWHIGLAKEAARVRGRAGEKPRHRTIVVDEEERIRRRQSTANRILTVLKAALNRAWRAERVKSDSAWRRVEPFENVEAARVRYHNRDEARRLINACDEDFRRLAHAGLQTGARYGELVRAKVSDFNTDSGTLAIRKSKAGPARDIVLTDEGAAFFEQVTAGRAGAELMFAKTDGTAWKASHQTRPMKEACARAGIEPPANFYTLRHTYASLAIMNGAPLMVVARNMGHADTRMCEKHYGHLAPSYMADAIRAGAATFGLVKMGSVRKLRPSAGARS